jgi:hypothetical protein
VKGEWPCGNEPDEHAGTRPTANLRRCRVPRVKSRVRRWLEEYPFARGEIQTQRAREKYVLRRK